MERETRGERLLAEIIWCIHWIKRESSDVSWVEGEVDHLNRLVKEYYAMSWSDHDSPIAESTFGVHRQAA